MKKTAQPGDVISDATLRSQDLAEAFISALEALEHESAPAWRREWAALVDEAGGDPETVEDDPERAGALGYLINEELADALNEHAPEGYYFGSHPGDGACFGFWPCEEDA